MRWARPVRRTCRQTHGARPAYPSKGKSDRRSPGRGRRERRRDSGRPATTPAGRRHPARDEASVSVVVLRPGPPRAGRCMHRPQHRSTHGSFSIARGRGRPGVASSGRAAGWTSRGRHGPRPALLSLLPAVRTTTWSRPGQRAGRPNRSIRSPWPAGLLASTRLSVGNL